MVAYNFQPRFAAKIQSGQKRQTIRQLGKRRHARCGEPVQLYTGMRTSACRKLIHPDPLCTAVAPIAISEAGLTRIAAFSPLNDVEGHPLDDDFARADGFETAAEMLTWSNEAYGLPFTGFLIIWAPITAEAQTRSAEVPK